MDRHGANGFSRQSIETGGLRGTWTQTTSPFLITGGRLRVLSKRKDGFARTTTKSRLSGNGPNSAASNEKRIGQSDWMPSPIALKAGHTPNQTLHLGIGRFRTSQCKRQSAPRNADLCFPHASPKSSGNRGSRWSAHVIHPTSSIYSEIMERARRFERPTPTLARLCSTPELRPLIQVVGGGTCPPWEAGR